MLQACETIRQTDFGESVCGGGNSTGERIVPSLMSCWSSDLADESGIDSRDLPSSRSFVILAVSESRTNKDPVAVSASRVVPFTVNV